MYLFIHSKAISQHFLHSHKSFENWATKTTVLVHLLMIFLVPPLSGII